MTPFIDLSAVVSVNPVTGCWEWVNNRHVDGYGLVGSVAAYRLIYQLANGPVADGLAIDHLCRFKACVNPAHLEAVTARENAVRVPKRAHLPEATELEGVGEWLSPAEAAARFSVTPKTLTRWASIGRVAYRVTAGGHRRYLVR